MIQHDPKMIQDDGMTWYDFGMTWYDRQTLRYEPQDVDGSVWRMWQFLLTEVVLQPMMWQGACHMRSWA
jgi:hypothetical protein